MKRSILLQFFVFLSGQAFSQSLAGGWKGKFETTVNGGFIVPSDFWEKNFTAISLRFILNSDSSYSVYSYTKGSRVGQKDTAVVCTVAGRVSSDSVFLEEVRVILPADYPTPCFQKMFLKIRRDKRSTELNGTWESVGRDANQKGGYFLVSQMKNDMIENNFTSGYSEVNGLKMYYEIYGQGKPLVLIHGGGSTIQTSFANIIPLLTKHRQIIAMELQAHGRTNDRDRGLSFEQDADDVASLLSELKISKADFLGFSNGGQTTMEIAIRHPQLANKIIIASAFYKRDAVVSQFWEGFDHVSLNDMPLALREGFLKVNNNEAALLNSFNRDVQRMKTFKEWTDDQMRSIKAPALVINGNNDVGSVEHAVEMYRIIPNCQLAILPGNHGSYLGTVDGLGNGEWMQQYVSDIIEQFLDS